ncbi:hypothetical protein P1J78_20420 [Psychromarinibacter sp. C21-152]|uniref:Ig-like domain-containing protein n=2 Tax=Psychromarinibacter sediminicola TaxID=3033385 RepID=A0AAE3NT85_9RHOB|nr:hypothetical protein [Psychromarinibacter sediminicola]
MFSRLTAPALAAALALTGPAGPAAAGSGLSLYDLAPFGPMPGIAPDLHFHPAPMPFLGLGDAGPSRMPVPGRDDDALDLLPFGFHQLYRDHMKRNRDWAGIGRDLPNRTSPPYVAPHPRPDVPLIPLPEIGPDAPQADDPETGALPDMLEMFRDGTGKLVFECIVDGTPQELPNDIRISNPYLFPTDAGVTLDWSAPLGNDGTVELPALAPGESAYLLDILPRGMAPGTVCTAVQR